MAIRAKRQCNYPGCHELVTTGYCDKHAKQYRIQEDMKRGTANQRGYTYRWSKYSKWFLSQPENVFCKLQLPGCDNIAQCVDHIKPHSGPNDPLFWDRNNHQAACIHCNSVKGRKEIKGSAKPFESMA